jgi:hypothetical protein
LFLGLENFLSSLTILKQLLKSAYISDEEFRKLSLKSPIRHRNTEGYQSANRDSYLKLPLFLHINVGNSNVSTLKLITQS